MRDRKRENMDIFNKGTKTCKKCGRELSNDSLHFPTDKSCKDGLRNICRECNPKYKRFLDKNHQVGAKWTDEEISILINNYKNLTNEELVSKFFTNRTMRAVESMASKIGCSHKTLETVERALKNGAKKNPMCKSGRVFSDNHKHHISIAQMKRYSDPEQRKIASENAIRVANTRTLDNYYTHNHPPIGEKNGRWKGGMSDLSVQLRRDIIDWKKESAAFCNYKCIFTGNRFQNIHHLTSFNTILDDVLSSLRLDKRDCVSNYTDKEYKAIKLSLIESHKNTLYGACLCEELHSLFHKEYTYFNATIQDFIDFSKKIISGYYDLFFQENNLAKNLNTDYIDYVKSTASSEVSA